MREVSSMGNFLNLFDFLSIKSLSFPYVCSSFPCKRESTYVTDTDKKIDKLDTKIDQLRTDMYAQFDKTDAKINQLSDKTDAKIEQLRVDIYAKFDKTDAKLDSNFNHINLRLDQAFNRPQKENDV